jgi:hypothetical protein
MGVTMSKKLKYRSDYVFIGLDPGSTGAATVLFSDRSKDPVIFPFAKKSPQEISDFLDLFEGRKAKPFFLIEKVHGAGTSFGGTGRTGGKVMFTFGWNAGLLYGLCVRNQLAEVTPTVWQKEFGLAGKKKTTTNAKKNTHKDKALKLFPTTHITLQTADSLLIALYCRRHYEDLF